MEQFYYGTSDLIVIKYYFPSRIDFGKSRGPLTIIVPFTIEQVEDVIDKTFLQLLILVIPASAFTGEIKD